MVGVCHNEDCLTTMACMRPEYVDLVVTSPPYDNLRKYSGYTFDFESTARALYRVIKVGGVVVWVVGDQTKDGSESGTSFKQALYFKSIGFKLYDTMLYVKQNPVPRTHRRYEQCFEYMFVLSKGTPKSFNPIMVPCTYAGSHDKSTFRHSGDTLYAQHRSDPISQYKIHNNMWCYTVGWPHAYTDKYVKEHPATFPEQLVKDQVYTWSDVGDIVYDPFMGAGTTAKACVQLGRLWVGSEVSKEYCTLTERRVLDARIR